MFASCEDDIPSPQEVAQFNLDIYNKNYEAVEKKLKENNKLLYTGYQSFDLSVWYPIHMAVASKDSSVEILNLIVSKDNVNLLLEPYMWTPLDLALIRGCNSEIIRILIDEGADVDRVCLKDECNIFHNFCTYRDVSVWNVIKEFATPDNLNKGNIEKSTPLCCLISMQLENDDLNDPAVIYLLKEFIEHGGNPNYIINFREYSFEVIKYLNENNYTEYKKILYEGMKNNPPVDDSEQLVELFKFD